MFVDAHCHLHFERITKILPLILKDSTSRGIKHFVVNATSPKDFEAVLKLKNTYDDIMPCFGIHPYYIDKLSIEDSLNSLFSFCNELKCNYCIGEIGMDKTKIKECSMDIQEQVFRKQVQYALSKSVRFCVHCVKCVGSVFDILQSELQSPYPFLMHGFSGSADFVDKFVKLGGYFSVSNYFLNLSPDRRKSMEDTIKKIPLDRLLFESDAPDMAYSNAAPNEVYLDENGTVANSPLCILNICEEVARIKSISPEELSNIVWKNSLSFYGFSH